MSALQDPKMQQFVQAETQRQKMQQVIHELNDQCWQLCVDKPGQKLDRKSETCLNNCVERFLDVSNFIMNRLESSSMQIEAVSSEFS